jgi:hypothetical protein
MQELRIAIERRSLTSGSVSTIPAAADTRGTVETMEGVPVHRAPRAAAAGHSMESLRAKLATTPDEAKRARLGDVAAQATNDERTKSHWFWTYDDILEAYGAPDEIQGSQSEIYFWYRGERGRFTFKFADGWLVYAGLDG